MIDVLSLFICVCVGGGSVGVKVGEAEGRRGIDIAQESGGPGERREEAWVVARDLSHSKLNLSSSLLLQPRAFCPWVQSAD